MMITVRPDAKVLSASWIARSDWGSACAVASSRIKIGASCKYARARVMRCRSPPERKPPTSPSTVSYPSGRRIMRSWMHAARAAVSTSARVADGFDSAILVWTESFDNVTSCRTIATRESSHEKLASRTSTPLMRTTPSLTS